MADDHKPIDIHPRAGALDSALIYRRSHIPELDDYHAALLALAKARIALLDRFAPAVQHMRDVEHAPEERIRQELRLHAIPDDVCEELLSKKEHDACH
jgi:hypothetical protein